MIVRLQQSNYLSNIIINKFVTCTQIWDEKGMLSLYIQILNDPILTELWEKNISDYFIDNDMTAIKNRLIALLKKHHYSVESYFDSSCDRLADFYIQNNLYALGHLIKNLIEEHILRKKHSELSDHEIIQQILYQQLECQSYLAYFQKYLHNNQILQEELDRNKEELGAIQQLYNAKSEIKFKSHQLYNLQPSLRQTISSNKLFVIRDCNYKSHSNSLLNKSHSLFSIIQPKSEIFYSTLRDYTYFIEAVSCFTSEWLSTTFGFLHTLDNINGCNYQIEYPIIMIDKKIFDLKSDYIDEIMSFEYEFPFNHDLRHHLIPVYADHFMIHHPDAPISFGGYIDTYTNFGKWLRVNKEEYEIWLWICHRLLYNTKNELSENSLQANLHNRFFKQLELLEKLYYEHQNNAKISSIVFHLLINCSNRFLSIFPFSMLQSNNTCYKIHNLLEIIWKTKLLISQEEVNMILFHIWIIDDIHSKNINEQIIFFKVKNFQDSRVQVIYAFEEMGLLFNKKIIEIFKEDILRRYSIIYPQRKSIQWFTERIQNDFINYDGSHLPALEIFIKQNNSIYQNFSIYNIRSYIRNKTQYFIYILQTILSQCYTHRLNQSIHKLWIIMDKKIQNLIYHWFQIFKEHEINFIHKHKSQIINYLWTKIFEKIIWIIIDYNETSLQADKYMLRHGISFKKEKKKILKSLMKLW